MACYGCTSKFSLLNKEVSCIKCSLSYCSKCMKQKIVLNGVKTKICVNCHKLPGNFTDEPPALLLKRLESMENPAKPPVTLYQNESKLNELKRGLDEKDVELINRLSKLKEPRIAVPSEEEIKQRLRTLQGRANISEESHINVQMSLAKKTNEEQVDDLLMEYIDEGTLKVTGDDGTGEIETRLAALRGLKHDNPLAKSTKPLESSSDDDEEMAASIVKKLVDESKLPHVESSRPEEWEPAESELPWCEICNEDAKVRCITCDGALYCKRCMNECHDEFELKNHKTIPFISKQ